MSLFCVFHLCENTCLNAVSGDGVEDSDGSGGDGGMEVMAVLEAEVVEVVGVMVVVEVGGGSSDGDRGSDDDDGV